MDDKIVPSISGNRHRNCRCNNVSDPEIDLNTIKQSYGWTIADDGEVWGLVAGDMGFEPTGIKIPVDHLNAWAEYNYKADSES